MDDDDILSGIKIRLNGSNLKVPKRDGNFYTVSTLSNGNSFLHSILKMLNREYNIYNRDKRLKMAQNFRKQLSEYSDDNKLKTDVELSEKHYAKLLCEILKINIEIYLDDRLYKSYFTTEYPEKRQIFCLLKKEKNIFEPIGYLTNNNEFFFNFNHK